MGDRLEECFTNPPDEFTPVPFWFWNDTLERSEILRQMADFRSKGVLGVVIHPRIGLPREIGYLSGPFLDLVEAAVEEAAATGMVVYLYDEGMYPSGSAHGMVVEGHPGLASRGIMLSQQLCQGPQAVPVRLEPGERLVSAQAVRWAGAGQVDLASVRVLVVEEGTARFQPPADGEWSILLFVETFSRGVIRGIHFGEDDWEDNPPPSADLLNPAATERFIELTHERYYRRLQKHFGRTIQAVFTDEPMILGRRHRPGLRPWTDGFLGLYLAVGGAETDLAALWLEAGPRTAAIRSRFDQAVRRRLAEAYYGPLSAWCADHGVALTGHPAESDDIGAQRFFQIPGQDQVLRWVAPEEEKGLVGQHSTLARCAADAARHAGKRRNVVECFGACGRDGGGWRLTGDDLKWMMDWLFVRGVNGLIPHAFYYSIRGPRRSGERPPDVGPNNIWWPDYKTLVRYAKRLSWLMTESVNVTSLAVLAEPARLPWAAVKPLYQHQVEFNYLEEDLLRSGECRIEEGELVIARQRYRWLLVDEPERLEGRLLERLRAFRDAGGQVVVYDQDAGEETLPGALRAATPEDLLAALAGLSPDVLLAPAHPDLRASHVIKDGAHFYLLVNEGEGPIAGELRLGVRGRVDAWDAWQGEIRADCVLAPGPDRQPVYPLHLERRASLILRVGPDRAPRLGAPRAPEQPVVLARLDEGWEVRGGPAPARARALETWTRWPGWENFSGTVTYRLDFHLPDLAPGAELTLDLGEVGELARVRANGRDAGWRWWAPYRFRLDGLMQPGKNRIEVEVTNTLANRMDEAGVESGLIGPVVLLAAFE
jgi:hypothetical protein